MEAYREYRGRRNKKSPSQKPKMRYFKKLAMQTLLSSLILGIVLTPGLQGNESESKIRLVAKSALNYKIDISKVKDLLSGLLKEVLPDKKQGENNNEATKVKEGNL